MVETDASTHGIGAVLTQKGHPLACFSKKLSTKMAKASTYVRELYAITQAVARWQHYLLGKRFLIRTDHHSLKELMSQVIQTPEQQYFLTKLLGYEFDIEYRTGKSNAAADALSRSPATLLHTYTTLEGTIIEEVHVANNHALLDLHKQHQHNTLPVGFSMQHGLILYNSKLFFPANSPIIAKVLHEFHSTPQGGHVGVLKTYKRVIEQFY